jgi:Leucine-rich repeat (LRR) protein
MSASSKGIIKDGKFICKFDDSMHTLPALDLSSLSGIDVCYCKLSSIGPIEQLTPNLTSSIVSFVARHNKLRTDAARQLTVLQTLTELHLDNNELVSIDFVTPLTSLKSISVSGNQLSTLPTLPPCLELFYALDNKLTAIAEPVLNGVPHLRTLALSGNQLTSLPDSIASLTRLTRLVVNNNNLQTLPESVGMMTQLTLLDVRSNPRMLAVPHSVFSLRLSARVLNDHVPNSMPRTFSFELLTSLPDEVLVDELTVKVIADDSSTSTTSSMSPVAVARTHSINSRVYIGDRVCAANRAALAARAVTHVINAAAAECDTAFSVRVRVSPCVYSCDHARLCSGLQILATTDARYGRGGSVALHCARGAVCH